MKKFSSHILRLSLLGISLGAFISAPAVAQSASKPAISGSISKGEAAKAKTDENAAEIIDNHLRFRGNSQNLEEAIRKIKSVRRLRIEGTIEERGYTFQAVVYRTAPDKLRIERTRKNQGWELTTVSGTDGKTCWAQETAPDPLTPQVLTGSPAIAMTEDAEFYPIFLNWRENGVVLQHRGETKIAGQPAYIIKASLPDGSTRFFYFDKAKSYLVCVGRKDDVAGARIDADIYPTKLEKINGVMFETGWIYRDQGKAYRTVSWDKVEVNPTIDDSLYAMPELKPKSVSKANNPETEK